MDCKSYVSLCLTLFCCAESCVVDNDSALDLCTIHRSVQDRIWKSVVHISCDEFNGTGIVIDKTDSDLYILTNLHMLGTDKAVLSHVSAEFERECASLSLVMNLGHAAGKRRKRRQKDDTPSSDSEESSSYPDMSSSDRDAESSSDPIKIKLQRHTGAEGLEFVLKFVLEPATCWAASAKNDFMIFKVPVPNSCLLEKCALGANDLLPTLPVHIFGFPGILVSDSQLRHNYAIITAEITGKDERGHFLLSALSTLAGGFGSKTEQYQCYGYGLECVPDLLPRFLNNTTKK
ncbi:hypothetical protein BDR26DRAFT_16530 [Obelidium mucronatum]|nr:hypothetical protein BDR26DRAFT_16530 [Obelidium mucronatum]